MQTDERKMPLLDTLYRALPHELDWDRQPLSRTMLYMYFTANGQ
jgi:hypothetical protein